MFRIVQPNVAATQTLVVIHPNQAGTDACLQQMKQFLKCAMEVSLGIQMHMTVCRANISFLIYLNPTTKAFPLRSMFLQP